MADEKRKDEYDIELGEKNGKSFSPARPAEPIRYTPAPSSSLQNNPVRCTPKKFTLSRFQPFLTTVHAKDPSSDFLLRQFDIDVSPASRPPLNHIPFVLTRKLGPSQTVSRPPLCSQKG
jgi:hypothetical protein